jgi:cytochrome c6
MGEPRESEAGSVSGRFAFVSFLSARFVSGYRFNDAMRSLRTNVPLGAALLIALITLLLLSAPVFADSGSDLYKAHCSSCHAASGAGDTMLGKNLKVRPLTSPEVLSQSDEELVSITSKGKNRMPAYGRRLSQQQIEAVVKHIRSLKK